MKRRGGKGWGFGTNSKRSRVPDLIWIVADESLLDGMSLDVDPRNDYNCPLTLGRVTNPGMLSDGTVYQLGVVKPRSHLERMSLECCNVNAVQPL